VVAELREIRDFLRRHPPFSALPEAALTALPGQISIRYLRRGSEFPPRSSDPAGFYLLRKGAVELRDAAGVLREKLAEGDCLDARAVAGETDPALIGVTVEDTLVYVLEGRVLDELRRDHEAFAAGFERSIVERLRRARESARQEPQVGGDLLRLQVADLVTRPPVSASPDVSLREAAALMTRERVSSLLVLADDQLIGIVTDRDLRSRCVAAGLEATAPLLEVMTRAPHTIPRAASAFEALMTMSRLRIHHLPVVDGAGVHGMISTHDLLRAQSTNPLYLADRVGRCQSLARLREVAAETRDLHIELVAAKAAARQLGQAITSICDAVTRRLIELEIERVGPPPVSFAWVATGSQGRGELTIHSDQDNALLLDDRYDARRHGEYFEGLARAVNEGLDACGYLRCPGDVMASNGRWRQPLATWRDYLLEWVRRTDHTAATLAANFFDMRTVWGEEGLRTALMREVAPVAAEHTVFHAYLVAHALGNQPPLGFFRNFVLVRTGEHEGTLDLKIHGLLPIVDLARVYAIAAGAESVGTQDRLEEALECGLLTADGADSLQEAFEFIWVLRARHQAEQLRGNQEVDNFIAPDELTAPERRHLKDAFAAIATMQRAARSAHGDRLPL
jgi:CBS domain-containing protein